MYAYRVETEVNKNHSLKLDKLPFKEGEVVEVIILQDYRGREITKHPLKGKVKKYIDPMKPVALSDWDALQ